MLRSLIAILKSGARRLRPRRSPYYRPEAPPRIRWYS